MNIREFYLYINEDFNDFFSRLPNVSSIEKFVLQFKDDPNYTILLDAITDNDIDCACTCALTLKGICLNLGFTHLSSAITSLYNALQACNGKISEECTVYMVQITELYTNIIEGIGRLEV